jgi:anti-sigma28 factor (negative regulator of flagellin synthesis)
MSAAVRGAEHRTMTIVRTRARGAHRDLHAAVRSRRVRSLRRRVAGGGYGVDVDAVSDAIARRAEFSVSLASALSSLGADEARS